MAVLGDSNRLSRSSMIRSIRGSKSSGKWILREELARSDPRLEAGRGVIERSRSNSRSSFRRSGSRVGGAGESRTLGARDDRDS